MSSAHDPVLIIGATGVVGRQLAEQLRSRWPDLPLLIGSRSLEGATALANSLGGAEAIVVDVGQPDLGLSAGLHAGAVVALVKDERLHAQAFAKRIGAAFIEVSSAVFELGPQVALQLRAPDSSLILASNWLAGASTAAALDLARELAQVTAIRVSAFLDEQDIGGAAADADYERQTQAVTSALVRRDHRYQWLAGDERISSFVAGDGRRIESQLFGNADVLSLASATGAADVSFAFAVGQTSSRRAGGAFSHEIVIDVTGTAPEGTAVSISRSMVLPQGQAPVTAACIALLVEAALGLGREALGPGLYLPDLAVPPEHVVDVMRQKGVVITDRNDLSRSKPQGRTQ